MKLSTKSTYGLKALAFLTLRYPESVSLTLIAKEQKTSLKYLEAIFSRLKKGGVLESVKGASGGYKLANKPEKISIYDCLKYLEDNLPEAYCLGASGKTRCSARCHCGVGKVMMEVESAVANSLKKLTLKDLI